MSLGKFIKAEEGMEKNSVVYYDEDGNKLIRHWKRYPDEPDDKVSTRSWRNNNPGNLVSGDFTKQHGEIGRAGLAGEKNGKKLYRAVFPDYEKLIKAMEIHEGWRTGQEEPIIVKKIISIRLSKKRVISEFLIGDTFENQWYAKHDAIALAEAGRLHAIVVHAKSGAYLRPEYHHTPFRQLLTSVTDCLISSLFNFS
jgi:hypothetical protein